MNDLKILAVKYKRLGLLLLCGLIVIVYGALGFIYLQNGIKQTDLKEQVAQLSTIVAKPLSTISELKAQYDAVTANLTPMDNSDAIRGLVEIGEKYGIDTTQGVGKFTVPPGIYGSEKVGAHSYQTLTYNGIIVQGRHENVVAFLNDIDSGITYSTIVLTSVSFTQTTVPATGKELERRQELEIVKDAVTAMMNDNSIYFIPNPVSVSRGKATNAMGDNPDTDNTREGFPDTDTPAYQKGYSGNATIKNGYLLWEHDRVDKEDQKLYSTVSYLSTNTTIYYYTCESNGKVRQWDNVVISNANEYDETGPNVDELKVVINIKFYFLD